MATASVFYFPDQTIPETQKDKDWHMDHAITYISSTRNAFHSPTSAQDSKLLRAYLGIQNEEECEKNKVITDPYGYNRGIEYQVYNLIEQKIEQLVGDYLDRPQIRKAYVMNQDAQSRILDAKIDMLSEQFFRELAEEFQSETGVSIGTPNPEMEVSPDVEAFFSDGNYKDIAEEIADDLIGKFLDVDNNIDRLKDFLTQYFIFDRVAGSIEIENGKIVWKMEDAFLVDYDRDPEKSVNNDIEWMVKGKFMTENEIYNTFSLNKEEKDQIKLEFENMQTFFQRNNGGLSKGGIDMTKGGKYGNERWYVNENHTFRMFLVDMTWKSPKVIRSKTWVNKNGQTVRTILGQKDRVKDGEEMHIDVVEIPRHVVMAGPEICLSWGEENYRMHSVQDPLKCRLNKVSIDRQNTVGVNVNRSVAQKLYHMQEWCSEILYEIRFAMRQNKGKAFVYDTAQTPKSYLKTGSRNPLDRVMHHINKDQIIFINSQESRNRSTFNQFTTVDLRSSEHVQALITGLIMVEELADRMIGFTPGRQGKSDKYDTATAVESQRRASFSRTEIYYRPFDEFVRSMLEIVLMMSKLHYKRNETIMYIMGDLRRKFLRMDNAFFDSDIGMYFGDPSKDMKKKEIIDQVALQSLGNAQTPDMISAMIDILFEDTAVEAKKALKSTMQAMAEMQQEREQQALEAQQAALQQKEADDQRKDDTIKRGQDKDVVVADIYADNKAETDAMKVMSAERINLANQSNRVQQ